MNDHLISLINSTTTVTRVIASGVIALTAIGLFGATALAAAGVLPWLELQVSFDGLLYEQAGQIAQIGFTTLTLLLCVYLPANARMLRLEHSHRRFAMGMHDVARAYAHAHAADRTGAFTMTSEYDAVRERMIHLRDHPDLQSLEPEILEVAAQMSRISHDLATTYSDANVTRARGFLQQRQQEVEDLNARLDHARQVTSELKYWAQAVDMDESIAASQFNRLRDDLHDILPELERQSPMPSNGRIVPLPKHAAE